jgi:hypothetical protein
MADNTRVLSIFEIEAVLRAAGYDAWAEPFLGNVNVYFGDVGALLGLLPADDGTTAPLQINHYDADAHAVDDIDEDRTDRVYDLYRDLADADTARQVVAGVCERLGVNVPSPTGLVKAATKDAARTVQVATGLAYQSALRVAVAARHDLLPPAGDWAGTAGSMLSRDGERTAVAMLVCDALRPRPAEALNVELLLAAASRSAYVERGTLTVGGYRLSEGDWSVASRQGAKPRETGLPADCPSPRRVAARIAEMLDESTATMADVAKSDRIANEADGQVEEPGEPADEDFAARLGTALADLGEEWRREGTDVVVFDPTRSPGEDDHEVGRVDVAPRDIDPTQRTIAALRDDLGYDVGRSGPYWWAESANAGRVWLPFAEDAGAFAQAVADTAPQFGLEATVDGHRVTLVGLEGNAGVLDLSAPPAVLDTTTGILDLDPDDPTSPADVCDEVCRVLAQQAAGGQAGVLLEIDQPDGTLRRHFPTEDDAREWLTGWVRLNWDENELDEEPEDDDAAVAIYFENNPREGAEIVRL